jgi:hypothetical protein
MMNIDEYDNTHNCSKYNGCSGMKKVRYILIRVLMFNVSLKFKCFKLNFTFMR